MAKLQPKVDMQSFSPEELLAELRAREKGDGVAVAALRATAKASALANVSTAELAKALREAQKLIYGMDDRQEAHEITKAGAQRNATGVASLIDVADIDDNGDDTSTIRTVRFGDAQSLCSGERFRDQPTSPFCTGFLVGRELLATAGHCVDGNSLGRTRFVFGFQMNPDGTPSVVIPNSDIYRGTALIAHKLESDGADYALVKLDRPVLDRAILPVRRTDKIQNGRKVYVIGHPSGLPLKYAPGAVVRDNSPSAFFVANLDTYGGNSGSPVFDEETDLVEGILVRGETDFVFRGSCRVSNVCPTSGCRGEDVTRATEFAEFIPELPDGVAEPAGDLESRVGALEGRVESILDAVKRIEGKLG